MKRIAVGGVNMLLSVCKHHGSPSAGGSREPPGTHRTSCLPGVGPRAGLTRPHPGPGGTLTARGGASHTQGAAVAANELRARARCTLYRIIGSTVGTVAVARLDTQAPSIEIQADERCGGERTQFMGFGKGGQQ